MAFPSKYHICVISDFGPANRKAFYNIHVFEDNALILSSSTSSAKLLPWEPDACGSLTWLLVFLGRG